MILKLTLLVSVPPGVVTTTGPVVAPLGTTAVMWVSLTTVKLVAKFFAEKAQDVGETTVVSTIRSNVDGLFHFNDTEIRSIRDAWNGLPKYSQDAVKELENRM